MRAQRFKGKVAVVTGGNSGIGLGVAKAYAQEGAQVAITGRNKNTLEAAAKEIGDGTLAIQSDAGNLAEIEAAMKENQRTAPGHAGDHGVRRDQSGCCQHGQNSLGRSAGKGHSG